MAKIIIDTDLPYSLNKVWKALTEKDLLSQWLMQTDFEPIIGKKIRFTGQPNKFWRGYVDCVVTNIELEKLIEYKWQSNEKHTPTTIRHEISKNSNGTTHLIATHLGFNKSHGWFSGLFFRTMIRLGMKKEFLEKLPKNLSEI